MAEQATTANGTTARNATLRELAALLEGQQNRKLDVVLAASALTAQDANLIIQGLDPVIDKTGVTDANGTYRPTAVADEGIADKLGIPVAYLRKMRGQLPHLYDSNVQGWLERDPGRKFLLRAFRGVEGADGVPGSGVARAVLSDSYKVIDNLDLLTAALDGVRATGHCVQIATCDLTDRRMYVRVKAEGFAIEARRLLAGYRSPFSGKSAEELPLVFAGFKISNSEVGAGAFTLTPCAEFEVCSNGLTITQDAMKSIHLGTKQDEGVVRWSDTTQRKMLELITARTADAVATFLSQDYLASKIRDIEEAAGQPVSDPAATVEAVTKQLSIPSETRRTILDHFIKGGQATAGGVMHAVTSAAQTLTDADAAHNLEAQALPALALAAKA